MIFTKMHGSGNDYIYVNCLDAEIENPSEVSKFVSDRHFGIGSDGLVLILPSEIADFRMRMFNSDGSESEMCGNAVRCVGKYVYDNGHTLKRSIAIETLAGIKKLDMTVEDGKVSQVKVDMGEPILKPADIPVNSSESLFVGKPVEIYGQVYKVTCVSMGNPHAVTYVDDVAGFPLSEVGPRMEHHPLYPRRINAEFAKVIDRETIEMRVWERGAGETLACGTGACAVLVASVLNGYTKRKAEIRLLGGKLTVEWNENDNRVYMTGPAVKVFDGEIDLKSAGFKG